MEWIETKVTINSSEITLAIELISNILYELDIHGLVIEDQDKTLKDVRKQLNSSGHDYYAVTGYIPKDKKTAHKFNVLKKKLCYLEKEYNIKSNLTYQYIAEKEWSECWKAFYRPEKISQKITVKPTWRIYTAKKDEIILEIDPGMAFGTGTHPTTRLCIKMIEKFMKKGDSFLDVGTGSGILMIAAAKLGAKMLLGIDNDEIAVEIAKKNLLQNKIKNCQFIVVRGKLIDAIQGKFNMVAANILTETILDLLVNINKILNKGGIIIASGILKEHKNMVVEKMKELGFEILDSHTKKNWVVITGQTKIN